MNRIITLLLTSVLLSAGGAFAQKDITAKELVKKYYDEQKSCNKDCHKKDCYKSDCHKDNCAKCSEGKDDEYLPICRDEAEELITRMIVEARAPYVKKREEDRMLQKFKLETLKRRLLDQALKETYVDEYKDRLDRMERLLMTLIVANNGKNLNPATITALLGGNGNTPKTSTSLVTSNLSDNNTTEVSGGTMENFLSQVFFALAKADLTAQTKETLNGVVDWMKENSTVKMSLRGYASPEGNLKFNNRLSSRRVNAVADYLISKGISRDRLEITPSGINSVTATYPEARRVDIRPVLCE